MKKASKYEKLVKPKLAVIEGWARDGVIDEDIAHRLGVAYSTLRKYRKEYEELADAMRVGKEEADARVESALFKNAVGYMYTEEVVSPDGEVTQMIKYQKPDTASIMIYLKNRVGEKWSNKDYIEKEKIRADIAYKKAQTDLLKGIEELDYTKLDALNRALRG